MAGCRSCPQSQSGWTWILGEKRFVIIGNHFPSLIFLWGLYKAFWTLVKVLPNMIRGICWASCSCICIWYATTINIWRRTPLRKGWSTCSSIDNVIIWIRGRGTISVIPTNINYRIICHTIIFIIVVYLDIRIRIWAGNYINCAVLVLTFTGSICGRQTWQKTSFVVNLTTNTGCCMRWSLLCD